MKARAIFKLQKQKNKKTLFIKRESFSDSFRGRSVKAPFEIGVFKIQVLP